MSNASDAVPSTTSSASGRSTRSDAVRPATLRSVGGGRDPDHRLPVVFTRGDALGAGISRHAQATRLERGDWTRLRTGTYCRTTTWESLDRRGRHLLLCAAVQRRRSGVVASHLSAAAAWGWPLPLEDLPDPWFTMPNRWTPTEQPLADASTRRGQGVRVEAAALPSTELVRHDRTGLLVTSPTRTLADCLRHLPVGDAIPIADAAAAGGVSRAALVQALKRQETWPYQQRAAASLWWVDPRRETWLESRGTLEMCLRGVPLPEAQPCVYDRRGRFLGRPDAWWPDLGLVTEFDGLEKYRLQGLTTPQDVERVLRREKEREDRLRDIGLQMVRAGTADVMRGLDAFLARWSRARDRGDAARVTGRIVPAPWPSHWPRV